MTNNFYKAINPLLMISKIFGAISITFNSLKYQVSKFQIYFKIGLCFIYLAFFGYTVFIRKQFDYIENAMMTTTDIMQYGVTTLLVITIWIFSARYQNKNIKILTRILGLDKDMRKLGVWISYKKLNKLIYYQIFVRCLVSLAVIAYRSIAMNYAKYTSLLEAVLLLFIIQFPIIMNTVVCQEVSVYIAILRERFQILNKHLDALQTTSNGLAKDDIKIIKLTTFLGTTLKMLRTVCPLHHELTKISEIINARFGIVLLMSFLNTFISAVVNLYFCSIIWQDTQFPEKVIVIVGTLLNCATYILETIYICHMCNTTAEEANKSGSLIHKIDSDDNDVKDQIEMFSLQIAHKRVKFSAAGLFPIDYTLLFSIIGGVTTNLVILIQFSQ